MDYVKVNNLKFSLIVQVKLKVYFIKDIIKMV